MDMKDTPTSAFVADLQEGARSHQQWSVTLPHERQDSPRWWTRLRETLRAAEHHGFEVRSTEYDYCSRSWTGEERPCSLDEFDCPPEVFQVRETDDLVELIWL